MHKDSFVAKKAIKQQQIFWINLLSTVILPSISTNGAIWLTQLWHNYFSLPTKRNVLLGLRVHIYPCPIWIQTSSLYPIRLILHILAAVSWYPSCNVSCLGFFVSLCYPVYSSFIYCPTLDYLKVRYQCSFRISICEDFNPWEASSVFH